MKKLILAVALVVASAAPVMAEGFPNVDDPLKAHDETRDRGLP